MFTFPAIVFFIIYYPFTVPAAFVLMHMTHWGLLGYWLPFALAALFQVVPLIAYIMCTDWARVVTEQKLVTDKSLDVPLDRDSLKRRRKLRLTASVAEERMPLLYQSNVEPNDSYVNVERAIPLQDVKAYSLEITPEAIRQERRQQQHKLDESISGLTLVLLWLVLLCLNAGAILLRYYRPKLFELHDNEGSFWPLVTSSPRHHQNDTLIDNSTAVGFMG